MVEIKERIQTLENALASGERVVQFRNGDRIEYRSIAEIKQALAHQQAQLRRVSGINRSTVQYLTQTGKGL